jgi:hypothetical protein
MNRLGKKRLLELDANVTAAIGWFTEYRVLPQLVSIIVDYAKASRWVLYVGGVDWSSEDCPTIDSELIVYDPVGNQILNRIDFDYSHPEIHACLLLGEIGGDIAIFEPPIYDYNGSVGWDGNITFVNRSTGAWQIFNGPTNDRHQLGLFLDYIQVVCGHIIYCRSRDGAYWIPFDTILKKWEPMIPIPEIFQCRGHNQIGCVSVGCREFVHISGSSICSYLFTPTTDDSKATTDDSKVKFVPLPNPRYDWCQSLGTIEFAIIGQKIVAVHVYARSVCACSIPMDVIDKSRQTKAQVEGSWMIHSISPFPVDIDRFIIADGILIGLESNDRNDTQEPRHFYLLDLSFIDRDIIECPSKWQKGFPLPHQLVSQFIPL